MKNEKTTLNDRLFTAKYLPSKNIYPPKDFPTPSICDIHCPTLAFSPCHRTWSSWNNPIGIRWQTPRWVLWSNPFSRVPVTPLGISHPERELKSVHLSTYHALVYFPKVIPGFCRGTCVFVVSYSSSIWVLFSDRVFVGFFLRVDSLWPLVQSPDGAFFQPQQRAGAKKTCCGSHAPNA